MNTKTMHSIVVKKNYFCYFKVHTRVFKRLFKRLFYYFKHIFNLQVILVIIFNSILCNTNELRKLMGIDLVIIELCHSSNFKD